MVYRITVTHEESEIAVETDGAREVELQINGATRARSEVREGGSLDCYLTTTLQTAYEHHSLVEARVLRHAGEIEVRLQLDGRPLLTRTIAAGDPPAPQRRDRA